MGLVKELIIPNDLFQDLNLKSSEFGFDNLAYLRKWFQVQCKGFGGVCVIAHRDWQAQQSLLDLH